MSDQEQGLRAISREYLAARIVIIGGLILAFGVGGYYAYVLRSEIMARRQVVMSEVQHNMAVQSAEEANAQAGEQLCTTALTNVKNFGVIPPFGQLASAEPRKTDVTGRYVCIAVTQVSKYTIAADLVCRNLKNAQCVNVFSVTQDDGTVLYQRHT